MENPFQTIIDELKEINRKVSSSNQSNTINNNQESENKADEILDLDGLCQFLKISKATAYKYCSQRLIPFCKREGRNYFIKSDILEWIKLGKIKTQWELNEEAEKFIRNRSRK